MARSIRPQQQTCKACGNPDKFDFNVPDDIWETVIPAHLRNRVVCLYCFDEFASRKGVSYAPSLRSLYFAGEAAAFSFSVEWSAE